MAKSLNCEQRPRQLEQLTTAIAACRICRDTPAGSVLPHEPRPVVRLSASARLLIAGQAPGTRVHATGLPFTDPSGDRLREWMAVDQATFYDTSRIAIVPMGFCFPGHDKSMGDLPPRPECRANWHDRIFAAMPQLELIMAIGAYAHAYHLPRLGLEYKRANTLTQTVSNWRDYSAAAPKVFVLPHPSWRNSGWLKKNSWFEDEFLPVLRAEIGHCLR